MLVDRRGSWYRVLAATYGEEVERLVVGGRMIFVGGRRWQRLEMG